MTNCSISPRQSPAFIGQSETGAGLAPFAGKPAAGRRIKVIAASRDVPKEIMRLEASGVYSDAVNCADERRRRYTLIAEDAEFQPRSILVGGLPALRQGEVITVNALSAPRLFDPRIGRDVYVCGRWLPLLREWADLTDEPELALLECKESARAFSGFSGMGPGLTPAGDDMIAGWITALRCVNSAVARRKIRAFYREWLPEGTTWLSKWMVMDALCGKTWKRGKSLIDALSMRDSGTLTSAAAAILNWGHTSGRAWLAGLAKGFIG